MKTSKTTIFSVLRSCRFFALGITACLAVLIGVAPRASAKPVKVYVMVGQSNMQGHGDINPQDKPNTLTNVVANHAKDYPFILDKEGKLSERPDVWIFLDKKASGLMPGYGANPNCVGPELSFGHKMGDAHDEQVLIIKTCWGGKSLGNDFLPPSIGNYPKPLKSGDPGYYYDQAVTLIKEATENITTYFPDYQGQGIEFAGLCYHQGWNDQYSQEHLANYEKNMVAFIKDIRSSEYGIGVPDLPIVIASSAMIGAGSSRVELAQLAIGDSAKHPEYVGNVAVIDTSKPYGPDQLTFMYPIEESPVKQPFHWNRNARTHLHLGMAMAAEMAKLDKPKLPSRLAPIGTADGIRLTWQNGTETPKEVTIVRNGKALGKPLAGTQTVFLDTTALPGKNEYELHFKMTSSKGYTLSVTSDTSATNLAAYRSTDGVTLNWQANGKYDGFKVVRDGKVIEASLAADARSFEDTQAPSEGVVKYEVTPTTGKVTPSKASIDLGPIDPGQALFYEPFDYPVDVALFGQSGAFGAKGAWTTIEGEAPKWKCNIYADSLKYGDLPVTGNHINNHKWGSQHFYLELNDNIRKAGLLEDGATLWVGYLCQVSDGVGAKISLQSEDGKEAIGFNHPGYSFTFIIHEGKPVERLLQKSMVKGATYLIVGKMVWGKGGADDQFLPYNMIKHDLKLSENHSARFIESFNIDQSQLTRLVLQNGTGSHIDEIRIGPTYESVIGVGTKK